MATVLRYFRGPPRGLQNPTVTYCYLNVIIQILYHLPCTRYMILTHANAGQIGGNNNQNSQQVINILHTVIRQLSRGPGQSATGIQNTRLPHILFPSDPARQQASDEALERLFNYLEGGNIPISNLFALDHATVYPHIGNTGASVLWPMASATPNIASIFTQGKRFPGNTPDCFVVKVEHDYTRPLVAVHLPNELDVTPYLVQGGTDPGRYDLLCIIMRSGAIMSGNGHYWVYVFKNGRWYVCEDEICREVNTALRTAIDNDLRDRYAVVVMVVYKRRNGAQVMAEAEPEPEPESKPADKKKAAPSPIWVYKEPVKHPPIPTPPPPDLFWCPGPPPVTTPPQPIYKPAPRCPCAICRPAPPAPPIPPVRNPPPQPPHSPWPQSPFVPPPNFKFAIDPPAPNIFDRWRRRQGLPKRYPYFTDE
ncbi:hypothetical protein FN846DRAFT_1013384 [Sphaerosporella brunnea]|uniref:USP domain-containing protein n=1 Tax=Sphaerosporella brunnea TaxID=1250544 RepID=A0A5J5EXB5_9PEZI|nr:hypothetical protein FN846DRAFT_1013384 [Sphaerosporella brunnea]